MEKYFCPVCGAEIVFDVVTVPKTFKINDNGSFERIDKSFELTNDIPYLQFYCFEDKSHDLGSSEELEAWVNDTEFKFYDTVGV